MSELIVGRRSVGVAGQQAKSEGSEMRGRRGKWERRRGRTRVDVCVVVVVRERVQWLVEWVVRHACFVVWCVVVVV